MASFVDWHDDWALGVPALDAQHRELADCLNRLAEASAGEGSDPATLKSLATELCTRARRHFRYEEDLMRASGYPGLVEHAREHAMLLAELKSSFDRHLDAQTSRLPPDLLAALRTWLVVHIVHDDRDLAEHLRHTTAANGGAGRG